MKSFIDNKAIKFFEFECLQEIQNNFPQIFPAAKDDLGVQFFFSWPTLLECLDQTNLFGGFVSFDDQSPLFLLITSSLAVGSDKNFLIGLYDELFIDCLTGVKNLPQMDPAFLVSQIQKKREFSTSQQIRELMDFCEQLLTEKTSQAMHDLILYLAWDRMCVRVAQIFEQNMAGAEIEKGLVIFKECLVESFQHITQDGKTVPGFFRFMEALYAYEMRDENLQSHSDEEWLALSQGVISLRDRAGIVDVFYIDCALTDIKDLNEQKDGFKVFTMEPVKNVEAALALAHCIVNKLKRELPEWRYVFRPVEIVCLKKNENSLSLDVIKHQGEDSPRGKI